MVNELLVNLVNSVLGTGKRTARGNQSYHCPKCNHLKPKLEVNFDESSPHYQYFACWNCGFKGRKIIQLFKQLKVNTDKLQELSKYVKNTFVSKTDYVVEEISLPKEFKPLTNIQPTNIIGRHALQYLKKRNVTELDILKYNVGYCEFGPYKNTIIIPSYDGNGKLNYFTSRSFEKDSKIKYKNPPFSRDIIPFEIFINWDLPITLCEGPFDALAIKRNAIPLLGKNIQSTLMKKIVISNVKKIYVALDKDAQKQALNFCEILLNEGKKVYLVELNEKDPSDLGFDNFTKIIHETQKLTFPDLLERKLQL
jgi:DNA primase